MTGKLGQEGLKRTVLFIRQPQLQRVVSSQALRSHATALAARCLKTRSAMPCEGEDVVLARRYFSSFISTLSNEPLITVTRNKPCGRPAQSRMSLI